MMKPDRDANPDGVVVVWIARISELRDSLPALEALLDAKERERATRFRQAEDRARFIAGRGLLRLGLRHYAPQVPASLEIVYSSMGRPLIPGRPRSSALQHFPHARPGGARLRERRAGRDRPRVHAADG
jgi:hypothetical protein